MSVESVNWSNYSSQEIVKMAAKGEEVPSTVLSKAQKEVNSITKDSADTTSYKITDSSGNYNGAQKTAESLKAQGLSKKEIAETMGEMCSSKIETLTNLSSSIEQIIQEAPQMLAEKQAAEKAAEEAVANGETASQTTADTSNFDEFTAQIEDAINTAGDAIELGDETQKQCGSGFARLIVKAYREAAKEAKIVTALGNSIKDMAQEASTQLGMSVETDNSAEQVKAEDKAAETDNSVVGQVKKALLKSNEMT